jgi:putative polysaccharide biosynthesis protein
MAALDSSRAGGTRQAARESPRFGFIRRRFGRWIALGEYGFPFSVGPYPSSIARFRAVARRARFVWHGRLFHALANIAMTLGWPVGAFAAALTACARIRERGEAPNGVRSLLDMYWLALRYSIPPLEYALYQFNRAERRLDIHEYVYWNDLPGLAALVERRGADNRDVQDKDRFANICAKRGFPHVPTLAVFKHGRQVYPGTPFTPDLPQIWSKALRLNGGAGGAKWIRNGEAYCDTLGRRVPAAKLAEQFSKQDCLVQPFIDNHRDVARVSNGALASLRIVTGMNPTGESEFVTALIALPYGARNSSVGGILCSIEPQTGRIRKAAWPRGETVSDHPDTGAPIIGVPLPFWHESVDLVQRAHSAAFPRFPFLGWDIALTTEGPMLLETNSGWGAIFHQMLDGPLGHTAFSRLIGQYV